MVGPVVGDCALEVLGPGSGDFCLGLVVDPVVGACALEVGLVLTLALTLLLI